MQALIALVAGLLFGLGLLLSGMANPTKVVGFLDLAGNWDPSLALVMAGAIGAALPAFTMARKRSTAWAGCALALPSATQIDAPLVLGSLTFGVGWGLRGAGIYKKTYKAHAAELLGHKTNEDAAAALGILEFGLGALGVGLPPEITTGAPC